MSPFEGRLMTRPASGSPIDPEVGRTRVDTKAVWDEFRRSVRALLHDQPSPRLVRATARRMDQYVLAAAEAEATAREQAEDER
ncbi:hypothetical protein ACFZCL_10275 [Streptomyces sp. NPDC008159]|uniref:hypothetical protein n=1 Tax=Streptomyces sp. NPDC008159 TaxID=3364817 RepID=UPI0036E52323